MIVRSYGCDETPNSIISGVLHQVYIKTKEYDDALEFLKRTLYLEPDNIKVTVPAQQTVSDRL